MRQTLLLAPQRPYTAGFPMLSFGRSRSASGQGGLASFGKTLTKPPRNRSFWRAPVFSLLSFLRLFFLRCLFSPVFVA